MITFLHGYYVKGVSSLYYRFTTNPAIVMEPMDTVNFFNDRMWQLIITVMIVLVRIRFM